jgi:N-acetylmuramoyl-L-alanine amidase
MSTKFKPTGTSRGVLFFGAGHGGSDPGAVKYLNEADINLAQAMAAKDYAVAQGFTVVLSRTKDENDPLAEEIKEANASGAICAVDFHNNAGGGDGFEAYYGIGSTAKGSKGLAQAIEKQVKAIGQNSRGCKTKANSSGQDYFGFIRQTTVPSVILEGCFVDNKTDVKQFDTDAELTAYGQAVAKGVINWLEASDKVKKQAAKPAATSKPAAKAEKQQTVKIELPVLTQGSKGAAVGTMQTLIEADGISCGSTGADKSFGPATDKAVRKYQKKHGLKVDGQCGLTTWTSLLK